jgi:acetylglutamate kinase
MNNPRPTPRSSPTTTSPHDSGRPVVVKLGGDVLEGPALDRVAEDLHAAHAGGGPGGGHGRLVVVHGGGAQVTALSAKLGLPTTMISGRRVTDAATLDVLKLVVAGRLNVDLCAALRRRGVPAVGLHAGSGIIAAVRRPPRLLSGAGPDPVDLGLVGDVTGFDLSLLDCLWAADNLPVLSCLGMDPHGQVLNINADMTSSMLAAALGARTLVAVTAVGGVRRDKDDPASRIARLDVAGAKAAIASGQVQGGMIAKLEEAFVPLGAGVGSVQIVAPGEIAAGLRAPGCAGTLLVR